ncbi:MAG TPA: ClpXP protease specificity-enhancing factor [Rhodocyclaceae bacterium]|nr:ClpXP protease specificity-enhancing factor [Rhodocyclaceae bacterium]
MSTVSTKPYLLRAIWQWCIDQGQTPYIVVAVDEHTQVPAGYVKDGQIVLNVGLEATNQLDLGNEFIAFQARFGGVAQQIFVPVERVAAIYSRESNEGMGFEVTETAPHEKGADKVEAAPAVSSVKPVEKSDGDGASSASTSTPPSDEPTPPGGGNRPRFTVVK